MTLVLSATLLLVVGGCLAFLFSRAPVVATAIGVGSAFAAGVVGVVGALPFALGRPAESLRASWQVPYGAFSVEIDALSGIFLLPIFAIGGLAALYGGGYVRAMLREKPIGRHWLLYNGLVASMTIVVLARNGVLFLMAWELMTLASYFLVVFDDERESVREAGWTYLVAAHLGTACLLALFVLLSNGRTFELDASIAGTLPPATAGICFALCFAGFGTKAGIFPFHVWLPEAHPAAPSHVSALLSAVLIKTGIYGILRTITLLGPPQAWWGWALVGFGAASALFGILSAVVQTDLKRLLAYSTVENAGLISIAIGLGVLGWAAGSPQLCVLGFGGALLHLLNHSLAKSLLFLAAGSVLHGANARDLDHMGGLQKRMRWTSLFFLVGALSISALPPLGGFAGEFLTLLGALSGAGRRGVGITGSQAIPIASLLAIASIALTGGLAVLAFTRAFGSAFLGQPRRASVAHAHEANFWMLLPMTVLSAALLSFGLASPWLFEALAPILRIFSVSPLPLAVLLEGKSALIHLVILSAGLLTFGAVLGLARWLLLRGRDVRAAVTWDCGYAQPTARMQYTASSFAQPARDLFDFALRVARVESVPRGFFPGGARAETFTPDAVRRGVYGRLFAGIEWVLSRLYWLQGGRVQIYVLYVALTLLFLLFWNFF